MSFTRRVSSHVTLSATHKRERSSQGNLKGRLQEKGQRLDTKREEEEEKNKGQNTTTVNKEILNFPRKGDSR